MHMWIFSNDFNHRVQLKIRAIETGATLVSHEAIMYVGIYVSVRKPRESLWTYRYKWDQIIRKCMFGT